MIRSGLLGIPVALGVFLLAGLLARGQQTAQAPATEPMSDRVAGKGADLSRIGHSPGGASPSLAQVPAQRIRATAERNAPLKGAPPVSVEDWIKVLLAD